MVTIKVEVNVQAVTNMEEKIRKAMSRALKDITRGAHRVWMRTAGQNLHSTKRAYMSALSHHVVDETTTEIVLHHPTNTVNWLVTAIEAGYGGIDLKKSLLSTRSVGSRFWSQYAKRHSGRKVGAPFLDVPFKRGQSDKPYQFRRITPGSTGWQHPGFRPVGKGGKGTPYRDEAKKYIREEGPKILKSIFEAIGRRA